MIKIGYGRDIHVLSNIGRDFILGGVKIPFEKKIVAHSDGDVLFHALAEALLGALALGDLGTFFPENDINCDNINSEIIVKKALSLMSEKGFHLINVDISIILEKPKLRPYIQKIKQNVAKILCLEEDMVSIKAQTNEKIDEIGKGLAIEALCALLIEKDNK